MSQVSITSIVENAPYSKQLGLPPFYYRWRKCNSNLTGNTPAEQYQRLKLIQKTARVESSLYTTNLGSLNVYQSNGNGLYGNGVCWNQMSDRLYPSVAKATIPTAFGNSMNKKRTSVTSGRPGCQTPGGVGCDIKHNSYDRYLNRLKGKCPLRNGKVPPNFGQPIPFNCAYPIYGGKTTKTSIVSGCPKTNKNAYENKYWQPYPSVKYGFAIGDYVYAVQTDTQYYSKATVTNIENNVYTVTFENGYVQTFDNVDQLLVYFPCNCNSNETELANCFIMKEEFK